MYLLKAEKLLSTFACKSYYFKIILMKLNYNQASISLVSDDANLAQNAAAVHIMSTRNAGDFEETSFPSVKKMLNSDKNALFVFHKKTNQYLQFLPDLDLESLRRAGATLYKKVKEHKEEQLTFKNNEILSARQCYAFMEGFLLASYNFNKYKKEQEAQEIKLYVVDDILTETQLQELQLLTKAVSLTKTLVNEPVNVLDALSFAEVAKQAGEEFGFSTEVLHLEKIRELKMGGLLAVNKGSETPPTFNIFEYKPENAINKKPLVLVGKGVMFDTGGYSLKISGNMLTMKSDMAGGAAVLGTLAAVAANKLPYHVIGLVPATDNKISANALVVDDVITMMDGTTVEVQNTDAEGRLVLADALTYAKQYTPELVIDLATLTGAAAAITGSYGIAVLGTAQEKIEELKQTGEQVYERLVQLPLWKEYRELLNSKIADISNLGGPVGGVSTSSAFLQHFTDYPWIHLDIAGPSFLKEAEGYKQSGGTGAGVRLLFEYIKQQCEEKKS